MGQSKERREEGGRKEERRRTRRGQAWKSKAGLEQNRKYQNARHMVRVLYNKFQIHAYVCKYS